MKTAHKVEKNFTFEVVCLGLIVRRDFTFSTLPLRRSNWISLEGLNADRRRTKNRKLAKFLRAQNTARKRTEQLRRIKVLFD